MDESSNIEQVSRTSESTISKHGIRCVDEESRYKGIPAVHGIAIGTCVVLKTDSVNMLHWKQVDSNSRHHEKERYHDAVRQCVAELQETFQLAEKEIGNVAAIFETYEFIVNDFTLNEKIIRQIIEDGLPAYLAVAIEYDNQKQFFLQAKDLMFRERAHDIEHVKERLLSVLQNRSRSQSIARGSIVVGSSISPQDVMLFNESEVAALVTEVGGITSHSCILARSLGIPAVIGLKNITMNLVHGSLIIVDGYEGLVITNPLPATIEHYKKRQREQEDHLDALGELVDLPSETTDGVPITLLANVDTPSEVENALINGADGIGLVRSEMLIIKLDHFPTEEEQFEWYTQIAERMYPNPVTIRAFDIGTDKFVQGLPHEHNPALGMRGIRFLLQRKDIFKTQLLAILRASRYKNIRLMLPMISRLSEVEESLSLIQSVKKQLSERSEDFDPNMQVGIMIETPSSAIIADQLARYVDFFSIGTNDLTQYTLAADRMNELVAGIYDAFNPAVLRLMHMAVNAAKQNNIPVEICGDLGGHSAATELIIGMGINEISVAPPLLLELKKRIRSASFEHSSQLFKESLNSLRPSDVRNKIEAVRHTR